MKAAELRAIAAKSTPGDQHTPPPRRFSSKAFTQRRRLGLNDYLYYGLLGTCGLIILSAAGMMLEDPEAREARFAEEARQEQVRRINRQKGKAKIAKLTEENAKVARIETCNQAAISAFAVSQNAVRARLKSPSSASFPWSPVLSQHTGDCKFQVLAYVDAQNGFGGMIRSDYVARLTYDPETQGWRVTSVILEN